MPQSRGKRDYHVIAAVGDPAQLAPLLAISCALAHAHNGRVTLLSVTPDGQRPDWLTAPGAYRGVPVEVRMRIGHSAGGAILVAVRESPPALLLLGWTGAAGRDQHLLGSTLDPLVRRAPCNVAVVRISDDPAALTATLTTVKRVLVPIRGGTNPIRGDSNASLAVELALGLAPDVQVTALNVVQSSQGPAGLHLGRERLLAALAPWAENERVQPKVVPAASIIGGILNEARSGYDLLLLGASHESYIDRMLFGNVPQTVAAVSSVPTIVIRRRAGRVDNWLRQTRRRLAHAAPRLTLAERVTAYRAIRRGARPNVDFFTMIGLSAAIAALGLLLNSPAVIIGAMLVAPMMAAFFGLGLGVVQGDLRLLRLSASATLRGTLLAVAIGALMGWGVPGATATTEVMSRANPTLLDLGVALVSGIAGAYALCRQDVSTSLPGVAIAAALVPPLAAIGIGLALGDGRVAGGALLLFLTNLIAISAAAGLVFLALGFRPELGVQSRARVFAWGALGQLILLLAVSVPLGLLTLDWLREADLNRTLHRTLEQEIAAMRGVELVDWQITAAVTTGQATDDGQTLQLEVGVRATRTVSHREVVDLQTRVAVRLQRPVALILTVIPTTKLDPFVPPTFTPTATPTTTSTPTSTPPPTSTPTSTATPTPPPTSTPTSTATPTPPPTSTPTSTPAYTPTPTPTPIIALTGGTGQALISDRATI